MEILVPPKKEKGFGESLVLEYVPSTVRTVTNQVLTAQSRQHEVCLACGYTWARAGAGQISRNNNDYRIFYLIIYYY